MATLKERFGKRLKQLRKKKNLTQAQLAERTGLSTESISNIERGIHAPKFATVEKLCETLDVPAAALFDFSSLDT